MHQGQKHFYDYWEEKAKRMRELEKRLGVEEGTFRLSWKGYKNFTAEAERVIEEGTAILGPNGQIYYEIQGADKLKKGVRVVVYDGKIQSMMPGNVKK